MSTILKENFCFSGETNVFPMQHTVSLPIITFTQKPVSSLSLLGRAMSASGNIRRSFSDSDMNAKIKRDLKPKKSKKKNKEHPESKRRGNKDGKPKNKQKKPKKTAKSKGGVQINSSSYM